MDSYDQQNEEIKSNRISFAPAQWGWLALILALCGIAGASVYYTVREHGQTRELAANNQVLSATLGELQSQLQAVSQKLNALTVPQHAPVSVNASVTPQRTVSTKGTHHKAAAHRLVARRRPVEDPRWNQVRSQLSEHEKQLASTREEVEKTRTDLQGKLSSTRDELSGKLSSTRDELSGKLSSTRDELNGSIARTHGELVMLQKRGERNYYEFHLNKTKGFQRVGPLSVSLRKVNFKRKSYNLAMIVDDAELNKKSVNLYEPVLITLSDRPQPLELVVNRINKNQVDGYVSEPKYKKSELTASTAAAEKAQEAGAPR
jgi:hypothetical protein